jgi:hypothetical protein
LRNHEEPQERELPGSPEPTTNAENRSEQKKPIDDEETQQFITTIASWLKETEETPLWYIRKIVRKAGPEQTMALLKEVLEIEQQGGMLVENKSRRRTVGGVFFYLAKGKGYLKTKRYPKKTTTPAATSAQSGQPEPTAQPAWSWEDRIAEIAKLRTEQGVTNVKITLIGRPGKIANRGAFIITTMQSSKVPALPKGLPAPAQTSTTYSVYIAQKQWKKVEESLRNPDDTLIAEGYPLLDQQTGTIAVFVSNTTTKLLQAAQRVKPKAEAPA